MIERLVRGLQAAAVDLDWRTVADALWLAEHRRDPERPPQPGADTGATTAGPSPPSGTDVPDATAPADSAGPVSVPHRPHPKPRLQHAPAPGPGGTPLTLEPDAASALPHRLEIGRALRPFNQRRRSATEVQFDVEATVEHFCETGVLAPLTTPKRVRWFEEAAIVVDAAPSMVVWRETVDALADLLRHHGAFARVTTWSLSSSTDGIEVTARGGIPQAPSALIDRASRRVTMLISDCVDRLWREGDVWRAVREWGDVGPVVIVQMLPTRLWSATALGRTLVAVTSHSPGDANRHLHVSLPWNEAADEAPAAVPVVTLDEHDLEGWAATVMATSGRSAVGVLIDTPAGGAVAAAPSELDPRARVAGFRSTVSVEAARLATLLAATDVTMPAARLLLEALIPGGRLTHLAEVLASGLLEVPQDIDPATGSLAFRDGIREVLHEGLGASDIFDVWRVLAPHLEVTTGTRAPYSVLLGMADGDEAAVEEVSATAAIARSLVDRLGLSVSPPQAYAARPEPSAPDPRFTAAARWYDALDDVAFVEFCRAAVARQPSARNAEVDDRSIDFWTTETGAGESAWRCMRAAPSGRVLHEAVQAFRANRESSRADRLVLCVWDELVPDAASAADELRAGLRPVGFEVIDRHRLLDIAASPDVPADVRAGPDDHAVVIGISDYRVPLPGAVRDARGFWEWLLDPAGGGLPVDQMTLLTDGSSDRDVMAVFDRLTELGSRRGRIGRRLYVYAAGHGARGRRDDQMFLIASRSRPEVVATVPLRRIADYFRDSGWFDEVVLIPDISGEQSDLETTADLPWDVPTTRPSAASSWYLEARNPVRDMPSITQALLEVLRGGPIRGDDLASELMRRVDPAPQVEQRPSSGAGLVFGRSWRQAATSRGDNDALEIARGLATADTYVAKLESLLADTEINWSDLDVGSERRVPRFMTAESVDITHARFDTAGALVANATVRALFEHTGSREKVGPMPIVIRLVVDLVSDADGSLTQLELNEYWLDPEEVARLALEGERLDQLGTEIAAVLEGVTVQDYLPEQAIESSLEQAQIIAPGAVSGGDIVAVDEYDRGDYPCQVEVQLEADVEWVVTAPTPYDADRFSGLAENVESGAPILTDVEYGAPLEVTVNAVWTPGDGFSGVEVSTVALQRELAQARRARPTASEETPDDPGPSSAESAS